MVTVMHLQPAAGARWLNYLALSLLLNTLLLVFITMPAVPITINTHDKLAIKLKAVAAPLPATPPVVQQVATQQPAQPITPPVVTKKEARKKITKTITKPITKPAPVPVQTPVEEQLVIEKAVAKKESKSVPVPVDPSTERQAPEKLTANIESTADDGGIDNVSVVQEARYRRQVPPIYPRRALELGQQGTVTLHARVKPDGLAEELKVVETSGHSLLDKAALAAVEKWVFEPVIHNGVATTGWVSVPIEFVIQ